MDKTITKEKAKAGKQGKKIKCTVCSKTGQERQDVFNSLRKINLFKKLRQPL